jgi:hypothetical protein
MAGGRRCEGGCGVEAVAAVGDSEGDGLGGSFELEPDGDPIGRRAVEEEAETPRPPSTVHGDVASADDGTLHDSGGVHPEPERRGPAG